MNTITNPAAPSLKPYPRLGPVFAMHSDLAPEDGQFYAGCPLQAGGCGYFSEFVATEAQAVQLMTEHAHDHHADRCEQ